jgi:hypothetical protein
MTSLNTAIATLSTVRTSNLIAVWKLKLPLHILEVPDSNHGRANETDHIFINRYIEGNGLFLDTDVNRKALT